MRPSADRPEPTLSDGEFGANSVRGPSWTMQNPSSARLFQVEPRPLGLRCHCKQLRCRRLSNGVRREGAILNEELGRQELRRPGRLSGPQSVWLLGAVLGGFTLRKRRAIKRGRRFPISPHGRNKSDKYGLPQSLPGVFWLCFQWRSPHPGWGSQQHRRLRQRQPQLSSQSQRIVQESF